MVYEKKVTDFHEGDRIEFRCPGYVKKVTSASVHVSLDDLNYASDVPVPPRTLTKLSRAPEMALEEAIELEVDDELVKAVDRVLGDLFWHAGKIAEPYPGFPQIMRKPWSAEDVVQPRKLVRRNIPSRVIARKLGRSMNAV